MTDEAIWNLVKTLIFGGAGVAGFLPLILRFASSERVRALADAEKRRSEDRDAAKEIRDELRAEIEGKDLKIARLETLVELWRGAYYELRINLVFRYERVSGTVKAISTLLSGGQTAAALAAAEQQVAEGADFVIPPAPDSGGGSAKI